MHHPKADIDRLYVKRKEEGRGLVQIETAYKAEIINIAEYLNTNYKEDQVVNIVKSHESTQPNEKGDTKQDGIQHRKARLGESLKKQWKNKVMHGQYIRIIDRLLVKKTRSSGYRRET